MGLQLGLLSSQARSKDFILGGGIVSKRITYIAREARSLAIRRLSY